MYCVDGSVAEDVSAQILLRKKKDARVFCGVSKADAAFAAAKVSACDRTAVSAYSGGGARLRLPLAVYDVDCDLVAGDVKLRLCDLFGDEADAFFVRGGKAKKIKLYELDRQKAYDSSCVLVLDKIPLLKKTRFDFDDLVEILRLLRAPDGCPWDRAQTHESIRKNMIEEAYELVDAIDGKDDNKIVEENGRRAHAGRVPFVLGEERGAFTVDDVLSAVCEKLIFRHSHIFGKDKATDEASALSVWDKNKLKEKGTDDGFAVRVRRSQKPARGHARAESGKARRQFGYDFKDVSRAAEKVTEELGELLAALREKNEAHIAEETGDLLFSAVNVGRLAGADCEGSAFRKHEKVYPPLLPHGGAHPRGRKENAGHERGRTLDLLRKGKAQWLNSDKNLFSVA